MPICIWIRSTKLTSMMWMLSNLLVHWKRWCNDEKKNFSRHKYQIVVDSMRSAANWLFIRRVTHQRRQFGNYIRRMKNKWIYNFKQNLLNLFRIMRPVSLDDSIHATCSELKINTQNADAISINDIEEFSTAANKSLLGMYSVKFSQNLHNSQTANFEVISGTDQL